ncbi:MAG: hypothetical protein J1E16_05740 [Muribaculaceae bacterium]|nr:hypothetical protein [Muribaculaceae bacterium]
MTTGSSGCGQFGNKVRMEGGRVKDVQHFGAWGGERKMKNALVAKKACQQQAL